MKRPIVVYAGQGLSLADKFNLTEELRWLKGHCFTDTDDPWDLDKVLLNLRTRMDAEHQTTERSYLGEVLRTLDLLCTIDAYKQRAPNGLPTTAALCKALSELADNGRLVVLFTSNLDCVARYEALANGATWLLRDKPTGLQSWNSVANWLEEIGGRAARFHYVPLHGEAGLISSGDGGSGALATTDARDPTREAWGYTTGEGLGGNVTIIEQRMHISQAGYRLFRALLAGAEFSSVLHNGTAEDRSLPPEVRSRLLSPDPAKAAHLLVVGYGAPHSVDARLYPFETSIDLVHRVVRRSPLGARWTAIVGPDGNGRPWLADHGCCVAAVDTTNICSTLITRALDELGSLD